MSAIASPEFISLCRAQLQLLTQQLSESSSALYMVDISEQVSDRGPSNYVPVVSYPEPVDSWVENFSRATSWGNNSRVGPLALPGGLNSSVEVILTEEEPAVDVMGDVTPAASDVGHDSGSPATYSQRRDEPVVDEDPYFGWPEILHPEQQLVVPLVYTEVVVGLLISVRRDRAWHSEEQQHIELVAQSLAAGCVLERRNHWLQTQLAHKRGLQSRQSEVFHNLLHQFRNPLTAVSTFSQLLVKRLEPEDPNQPIATGIVRESKRLKELVAHFDEAVAIGDADLANETSAASRLPGVLPAAQALLAPTLQVMSPDDTELGHDAVTNEDVLGAGLGHPLTLSAQYLPDIVDPILAVAQIVSEEKGVDLRCQVASDTPAVWGEEEALGEVVSNLVDNAIKYSPPGAQVWVQTGVSRVGQVGHYQGVVVGDTGPGIPAVDQQRLFERNYRGVQAQGDIPGTGLGLAIAQSLVQEMQGAIEVISPAAGTPWMPQQDVAGRDGEDELPGTVFIVWLLEVEREARREAQRADA
ncbi:MAG: GAF domain-containing sensor histidine kinase [Cyanobacteria bacterium P01_F01_bin.53]